MSKCFQNDRIYVDENGEQIRDKIVYQDIVIYPHLPFIKLTFSQLMPRNYFGGRTLLPFEMYVNLRRIYFGEASMKRDYPKWVEPSFIE